MEKNQIYKAFQQERYQIEERLKRFKEEVGGEGFSGSWNDLTDKPFYSSEGMTVEVPVVNGEFTFDLPGVTMEQECIVAYSGDSAYKGFEANLLDLASTGFFVVDKMPTSALVDIEVTDTGVHCTGRIVDLNNETATYATGSITVVVTGILVTLDDKYISENIARVSDVDDKLDTKADKAEVYTKTEVDEKVMIRYCGERYDMESLDPEHGFGANYGDVYNILDANGYVDVNGKKLYGSTFVVCTRSKDGDLGWAEFDINDLLNACRREDIVFKHGGFWDSLESLKQAVENNNFWPALGDVYQIDSAFVDMYGNAREYGYVVYAQDPTTREYGWAVFDISTLANTYTRAEIDKKNYISKAELQNILNQITVTTAEDGTISLNIPTIS